MDADPRLMRRVAEQAFGTVATELPEPVDLPVLEGALPTDLRGVLLRNGPGRPGRGGVPYGHPFDGDGFVQRLEIDGGHARYRARFVRTREFEAEEEAGRILFRGFGTRKPGGLLANAGRMRFKNAANTSIIQHAGRTLALWEGGLPHALDPETLQTLGRDDFDGALRNDASWLDALLNPELPFAAHPARHADGTLYSFGTAYGRTHRLLLHRVDLDGALTTRGLPLDDLPFVHDFVLTERFAVFLLPRVAFDVPRTLLGLKTPVESLRMEDAPGTALVVPLDGGEPHTIEVAPGFVFHWAAGWEEGERVVLDGVKYPGFPEFDDFATIFDGAGTPGLLARPVRITLDLAGGTSTEQRLSDVLLELPQATTAGRDRIVYGTAAPPDRTVPFLSALARLDAGGEVVLRDLYPDLPGEPLLCGGWVVAPLYRHDGPSEVLVLDPEDLSTVARLGLPDAVPPPLHGTWLPQG